MNPNRVESGALAALRLRVAALWLSLLCGCGGGYDAAPPAPPVGPAPPPAFVAESSSAVLGKGGGTVTLTTIGGTVYELSVPAGAVKSDTTFILTTQEPVSGQRFNLKLQPVGLVFARGKTATLVVTLPAGQSLPGAGGLAYRGAPIPFTTRIDGKLEVELSALAGSAAGATGTGRAGRLRVVRPLATASAAACGAAPQLGANDPNGMVAADAIDVELYGQCMVAAVDALVVTEQFQEAVKVSLSVAAYLQRTGSGDAAGFIARAGSATCTAYANALDRGGTTPVTGIGTLYQITRPIMFWEHARQQLGVTCNGIAGTTYQHVINAKVNEAIALYDAQKPSIVSTQDANYRAARTEARESSETTTQVLALNPGPVLRSTLDAEVVQRAQPGVIDSLLQAPWASCRNDSNYDELIGLAIDLDSPPAIQQAAQFCATQLNVRSEDSQRNSVDDVAPTLGGVRAGYQRGNGTLYVPKDGKLFLRGPIGALKCVSGPAADEGLAVKLNGTVLQTLTPPYFDSPLEISMALALDAAHLDSETTVNAKLILERTGSGCDGLWGSSPQTLASIDLSFKVCVPDAGQEFCLTPVGGPYYMGMTNAKGQALLIRSSDSHGFLWENGQTTPLPAEFSQAGSGGSQYGVLLDDGTVVGNVGTDPFGPTNIAVVANGAMTTLFTSTIEGNVMNRNADTPFYFFGGADVESGRLFGFKSYNFYTTTNAPPDYCQIQDGATRDGAQHRYYCDESVMMRFSASGADLQEGPSNKLTDAGFEKRIAFGAAAMNGSGVAVGAYTKGNANPLEEQGAVIIPGTGDPIYIRGAATYVFIDAEGAIYSYGSVGTRIESSVAFPPPLSYIGPHNSRGDVVSCDFVTNQLLLTNLHSGKRLAAAAGAVTGKGWTAQLRSVCAGLSIGGFRLPGLDRHARGLAAATDADGAFGTVIVTPRGKRLPY